MAELAESYVSVFHSSIARIYHSNGSIVGAGFLVSPGYLITCAHVIAEALGIPNTTHTPPTPEIAFDFPLISPGEKGKARVIFWRPVADNQMIEDIAGLAIEYPLPPSAKPVNLSVSGDLWGHSLRVFGFPKNHDDGVWATGVIRDKTAKGWLQMEDIKVTGYAVEPGFSGAPIWDEQLQGVVGMAVAAERKREDAKVAFLISSDTLVQAWGELIVTPPAEVKKMRSVNRIQEVKRGVLQQRLESLLTNYQAAYNQLNYTLGAVDRQIIQNQIVAIEQDIEKVSQDIDALGD
jgi:S1-C subfamily serine protease